jgi:hypothetical protein
MYTLNTQVLYEPYGEKQRVISASSGALFSEFRRR